MSDSAFDISYNTIYFMLFVAALFLILRLDFKAGAKRNRKFDSFISIFFFIAFTYIVGCREYNVGTDTYNYHLFYWIHDFKSESKTEFLFDLLISNLKLSHLSFTYFLTIIAILFYFFIYRSFRNLGDYLGVNILILAFIFFSMFFAKSLSINVIRQGLSLSFLLFAYSLWFTKKSKKLQILYIILAVTTHTTSLIPVILFYIVIRFSHKFSDKHLIILYFSGILVSAAGLGILNLAPFLKDFLSGDKYSSYLVTDTEVYSVGFKPQFVAFNSFFLLIFMFILKKTGKKYFLYEKYRFSFAYYIVASFLFFLMFQIPYSDRFGLLSWIMIPILSTPLFIYRPSIFKIKTPLVILFALIYIFFTIYGSQK